jgi:hypothetical protein
MLKRLLKIEMKINENKKKVSNNKSEISSKNNKIIKDGIKRCKSILL